MIIYQIRSAISRTVFDLSKKREEILKIEEAMADPEFWSDKEAARQSSQRLNNLKKEAAFWDSLMNEVSSLKELLDISSADDEILKEIEGRFLKVEEEFRKVETRNLFSGKYDKGNAVVSVYSGAGGKDAEDWSSLLFRMYRRFAEKRGWDVKVVHEHWGEFHGPAGWGLKNATMIVSGDYAYGYLKKESGVHRLVRISPFSAQQLRHTSFSLVDVMPEFVAPEEVELRPEDLKIDFFRSSGPGGQNVNKRETAVRITHLPSGIQVASQVERSQERNREIALQILRSRIYQFALQKQEQERQGVRKEKVSIEWSAQIRSYVFHPYRLVKDHRTNIETLDVEGVLDGELDKFIEAEIHKT